MLIVEMNTVTSTLDKTWSEILAAPYAVVVIAPDENTKQWMNITAVEFLDAQYSVTVMVDGGSLVFIAETADGYPVMQGT